MKTPGDFSCQILKLEHELLISLQGNLDMYTTSILQENLWGHLDPDINKITIDCDWVQYVDSSFLQFLTRVASQVETVRVINASRTIRKIFKVTGLDEAFIVDD